MSLMAFMAWDPQFSLGNLIEIVTVLLGLGGAYASLTSKVNSIQEDVTEIKSTYLRTDLDKMRQQITDERYDRLDKRIDDLEDRPKKQ